MNSTSSAEFDYLLPFPGAPRRRISIRSVRAGGHYDLGEIMADLGARFFGGSVDISITWGKRRRRSTRRFRKSSHITLGSYSRRKKLITIHPNLDNPQVPRHVVEATVFHEMCHHATPEERCGGRRRIHTPKFRGLVKRYPRLSEAKLWQRANMGILLRILP